MGGGYFYSLGNMYKAGVWTRKKKKSVRSKLCYLLHIPIHRHYLPTHFFTGSPWCFSSILSPLR
jgi:hypothetical protein